MTPLNFASLKTPARRKILPDAPSDFMFCLMLLCIALDRRQEKMTALLCALKNLWSPDYVHGYFSRNFQWAFIPIDPMNGLTKFAVRSFTRSWANRSTPKIWAVHGYAHASFLGPVNVPIKFEVRSSWDDWSFGLGSEPQSWGKEGRRGSGWYRSKERWWVPIGPP